MTSSNPKKTHAARNIIFQKAWLIVLVAAGCQSNGYKKGDDAAVSLRAAAQEVQAESQAIDATLEALNDLIQKPAPDLKPQFKYYSPAVDRLERSARRAERTRAGGLVVGVDRDLPLSMDLVSNLADVKAGDLVVASGVDGIYPKGFTIGRVESSERGPGLYRAISVRPSVDFSSLEEVLVVLVPPRSATPEDSGPVAPAPTGTVK